MFQGVDEGDAHAAISLAAARAVVDPPRRVVTYLNGMAYIKPPLLQMRVQAALELERARLADIALEDLAVIAGRP